MASPDQYPVPARLPVAGAGGVVTPTEIIVDWTGVDLGTSMVAALEGENPPTASELYANQLLSVMRGLAQLQDSPGPGCLAPWGLRWIGGAWALATTGYVQPGERAWLEPFNDPGTSQPAQRDLYAIGCVLARAALGRWAEGPADATEAVEYLAGFLPLGYDVIVRQLIEPDTSRRACKAREVVAALDAFLGSPSSETHTWSVAYESVTGSSKARLQPVFENEDVALWRPSFDVLNAVVFDGITGPDDGSGARAAQRAAAAIETAWQAGETGSEALRTANSAVGAENDGSTVAVTVAITRDGNLTVSSAGDSSAWLIRDTGTTFVAARLTPTQTEHAAAKVDDANGEGSRGAVTSCLDGHELEPFSAEFVVRPGDLVVLASDGVTIDGATDAGSERFPYALTRLAIEAEGNVARLAAQLCWRAEQFGGRDNATAIVIGIDRDSAGRTTGAATSGVSADPEDFSTATEERHAPEVDPTAERYGDPPLEPQRVKKNRLPRRRKRRRGGGTN